MKKIKMSNGDEFYIKDDKAKNLAEYLLPNKMFPVEVFPNEYSESVRMKYINYSQIVSIE